MQEVYPLSPLLGGGFPKEGGDACSTVNSFGVGGGCAASAGVSKMSKMSIESLRRLHSGRLGVPLLRNKVQMINDQLFQPPSIAIEKTKTFKFSFSINDQLLGRSYRFELFESKKPF